MFFSKCPSIRSGLVHNPALFQVGPTVFGCLQQENVRVPAQGQVRVQLQVSDFMKIQAGVVMDQPLPLRQAPVLGLFCAGVGDRGDVEFGSASTSLMNAMYP